MNVSRVNNVGNSFRGLLTITGPDKDSAVTINTDNVSTIVSTKFMDKKDEAMLGIGVVQGSILSMNSGTNIHTFLPLEKVIDAYKQAKDTGSCQVETKYNPILYKPLWGLTRT